jgi:hypothetical protein
LGAVGEGARPAGSLLAGYEHPSLVRPVLFHLLWRQLLAFDLNLALEDSSLVFLSSRRLGA